MICSGRCKGKANYLTMWSHPNLSESVTKGSNSIVKCADHVRSKAGKRTFTNVETVSYIHVLNVIAITRWYKMVYAVAYGTAVIGWWKNSLFSCSYKTVLPPVTPIS